ncbi:MAG: hypothetical protein M0019_09280 [Actinomycetota bacterium]|nr:hypothetical protein [Actinomycetota bacterium]
MNNSRVSSKQNKGPANYRARRILLALVLVILVAGTTTAWQLLSKHQQASIKSTNANTERIASSPSTTEAATTTTIDPGLLPQTNAEPKISGSAIDKLMKNLFYGITQDSIATALSSFFTLDSYLSVKSLKDDAYDYAARLIFHYTLDIEAAHNYIASQGAATYVGFYIPKANVHYVQPNTCYNRLGYWMAPDARILYSVGGVKYSIGVASLISWRGLWYVVHLGAINRTNDVGIVYSPALGIGPPGPTGGC